MSFFYGHSISEVQKLTEMDGATFNHSLAALRFARKANGVSKLHGEVSRKMWGSYPNIPEIRSITNAQNWNYWADKKLFRFMEEADNLGFDDRKRYLKKRAFEIVADQTGKLLDPDVLTIVWARRFAAYKRPELITRNLRRFDALMRNADQPIQIIWQVSRIPWTMARSVSSTNWCI
ncbi:hypothetical protein [Algoriphagus boritolerans]|uniref:hypothetical protein n=1 Tax=Algoriphagus boritolerans TaxID=308111 RepID=UPI000A6F484A